MLTPSTDTLPLRSFPTRRSSDLTERDLTGRDDFRRRNTITIDPKTARWCCVFGNRSEEHTSELQSPVQIVCRFLLDKIHPQIAQTIVHLGVDLSAVTTKASMADA